MIRENTLPNNHIQQHVHEFILRRFPLARKKKVTDSDQLLENGIIDSLGMLDLVSALEKDFGISISDEELVPENFQTVADIAAFVATKQPSSQHAG